MTDSYDRSFGWKDLRAPENAAIVVRLAETMNYGPLPVVENVRFVTSPYLPPRRWPKVLMLGIVALGILIATSAEARDRKQRAAFVREHPCPATGKRSGACPGYVVDHVIPLCAGGPDAPSNMQWQGLAESKAKDRLEDRQCAALRRARSQ